MTNKAKKDDKLSAEQICKILHISKRKCAWMLQNGMIPCKDSGKKTRRYAIRIDDIILYLIDREIHPENYRAPDLWYKERSGHYNSRVTYRRELFSMTEEERRAFRKYIVDELAEYDDVLTIQDAAEITGYCDTSFHRWCQDKRMKSFFISGKILIPKISLIDFLVSPYCCSITRKTWKHLLLIRSYLDSCKEAKT